MENFSSSQLFEESNPTNFREIIFRYIAIWPWFILTLGITLATAYTYLRFTTPVYEVKASLLIKDEKKGGQQQTSQILEELNLSGNNKLVENEIEILKSRTLTEKVIEKLNLTTSYWIEGQVRDVEIYKESPLKVFLTEENQFTYKNAFYIQQIDNEKYALFDNKKLKIGEYKFSNKIKSSYGTFRIFLENNKVDKYKGELIKIVVRPKEALITSMVAGLKTQIEDDKSTVIKLTINTTIISKGKDILNSLLEEYVFNSLQDKNREATNTLKFIEGRLKIITSELGDVEQDVEQYKRSAGITDLSTEANLFLEKVKDNDAQITDVDINLKVLSGVERYVSSAQLNQTAPSSLMVSDPVLSSYLNQLTELNLQKEKISRSTTSNNPFTQTLNNQIANLREAIKENLNSQKEGLEITKKSLMTLNNRLENGISTIPKKERQYVEIKRQASIKENLYLLLLKIREETALTYASTISDSRIINLPFGGGGPISPNRTRIWLIALAVGFITPILMVLIQDALNYTIQSKKELEKTLNSPIFGELGHFESVDDENLVDLSRKGLLSEQFRMIRSNLQFILPEKKSKEANLLLITSSTAGEGKSFVAANMAAAIGLLNKRVMVIGLDLRKPKLNSYIKLDHSYLGLTNYLIGNATIEEIVYKSDLENVFLIPSGPIPPNPSELISSLKLGELLDNLKKEFDYILIDTPPLSLVTDALLIAKYVDATFFIIRQKYTPRVFLETIKEYKKTDTLKSLQVILNDVDYNNQRGYGYGYGYGNGYGYGYYGEEDKSSPVIKRAKKLYKKLLNKLS
ncbi:MAG: polysaccharide biosynthesis tyrosine autokinase [Leadbetterella sp.]|nr:polysaccharide biosynthesis tyrosine autokinase [Leadbetterella sp.]